MNQITVLLFITICYSCSNVSEKSNSLTDTNNKTSEEYGNSISDNTNVMKKVINESTIEEDILQITKFVPIIELYTMKELIETYGAKNLEKSGKTYFSLLKDAQLRMLARASSNSELASSLRNGGFFGYHYSYDLAQMKKVKGDRYSCVIKYLGDNRIRIESTDIIWDFGIVKEMKSTEAEYRLLLSGGDVSKNENASFKLFLMEAEFQILKSAILLREEDKATWIFLSNAAQEDFEKRMEEKLGVFEF